MPHGEDEKWMLLALETARQAEGLTRPNPPVGAVLVKNGKEIGRAYHKKAGGPHAEALLLRQLGHRARGATIYVTLEPCSTHGRTPPCTDAILKSGVARVVVGASDPNPRHAGRGLRLLRKHGIEVTTRVAEADAKALIEPFDTWIRTGRPWLTLKLGMTLDGRIADADGSSRWITGRESRALVQAWRRRCDAILVGAETARRDDPSLLPRPACGRAPWRVVLSSDAALPTSLRLFNDEAADRTLVLTTDKAPAARLRRLARTGAQVVVVPSLDGRPSPDAVLAELGRRGVLHLFCEGGGAVAGTFLRAGLVDELLLFHAPVILGGSGRASVASPGWSLAEAPRFRLVRSGVCGEDIWSVCRPAAGPRKKQGG